MGGLILARKTKHSHIQIKEGKMDEQEAGKKEIKKDALPVEEAHPIARAINVFLHQIRDIESNAKYFIPAAKDLQKGLFKEVKKGVDDAANILKTNDKNSKALGTNKLIDSIRKIERLQLSRMPFVLESSLYSG